MLILRKKFLLYLYRTNLCHMSFHRTLENVSVSLVQKTAIEVCVCVCVCVCVRARVRTRAQLCPTFCNPMDSSPPNCYKGVCGVCVCVCVCVFAQSHPIRCNPMDCSLPDSSVHGILQVKVLEQIAIFSSRGIFQTQGLNPCLLCMVHWLADSLPPCLQL